MWPHSLRSTTAAAVLLALFTSGCATATRDIPIEDLTRRTTKTIERDQEQCAKTITGKVKGPLFPGELEFAACMIARNYRTFVQVFDVPFEVRSAKLPTRVAPSRVLNDLVTCDRVVGRNISWVEKIGRPVAAVVGIFLWPVSIGSMAASYTLFVQRERDYTECMEPRGYIVTMWVPDAPSATPNQGITTP
jgi:hypothetical protein